jgi:outer membrane protein assembly factor BamA
LRLNSEFRAKLFSIFNGAAFVDAGNIWLFNENPQQPGGKFTGDFMKQLAVDAGLGLRIDLTILLLRLDVAIPLKKPWLPANEQQIQFGNSEWRKQNIIYNLAIGLPF